MFKLSASRTEDSYRFVVFCFKGPFRAHEVHRLRRRKPKGRSDGHFGAPPKKTHDLKTLIPVSAFGFGGRTS